MLRRSGSRRTLYAASVLTCASLVAAGCGTSVEDAEQRFCSDVFQLRATLEAVDAIDTSTSAGTVRDVREQLDEALRDVRNSAQDLKDAKVDELEDAGDDMRDALKDVDDDTSLADARSELAEPFGAYLDSVVEVARTSCATES